MLRVVSMFDVDTFIEQATKIADKAKRHPDLSAEARREAHILLEQLEECLAAKGLTTSNNSEA